MRVLDGAVAIFDAVHGVQAQSETVWKQADRYGVPRVAYVNKLDRDGSSLGLTLAGLRTRLGCAPLLLQLPVRPGDMPAGVRGTTDGGALAGLVDLVSLELLTWHGVDGERVDSFALPPTHALRHTAAAARGRLIEALAEYDDEVADAFLADGGAGLSAAALRKAIRRAVVAPPAAKPLPVPVLLGSSFRKWYARRLPCRSPARRADGPLRVRVPAAACSRCWTQWWTTCRRRWSARRRSHTSSERRPARRLWRCGRRPARPSARWPSRSAAAHARSQRRRTRAPCARTHCR